MIYINLKTLLDYYKDSFLKLTNSYFIKKENYFKIGYN
jgi:hypothetical protein